MRLYLINPCNPLVGMVKVKASRWNRYTLWKPLGLLILAALTPPEWEVMVIDEHLGIPDYAAMPSPDLVGITAFTAQAPRAYQVAAGFRSRGVPVVMGGIHATMCLEEAMGQVDAVVTGEAEEVWPVVLDDARRCRLNRVYAGTRVEMDRVPPARHDLLPAGYLLGSIQTARGCPLNCSFCSVTAFNGGRFRHRPIGAVVQELQSMRERQLLIVDDNLVGIHEDHLARAKDLFRAMIRADLGKKWIAQATINIADDDELLRLAARAGCSGIFVGFESWSVEGLAELNKRFNVRQGRDLRASVQRIHRHGIPVLGQFIIGLDADRPGAGQQIADAARHYGLDALGVSLLTPLPGTRLWDKMEQEGRIVAKDFPEDWQYYTLSYPVARYMHLSWAEILDERKACMRAYYAYPRIAGRLFTSLWHRHNLLPTLVGNLFYRDGLRLASEVYRTLDLSRGQAQDRGSVQGDRRV
jgi:radical SAM superfamily enzyme YgiQ (UPF0313 family)